MTNITPKKRSDHELQKSMNDVKVEVFQDFNSINKDFFESTTTHGLSRIYSSGNIYIRGLWVTIFLAVLTLLTLSVYKIIAKLTEHGMVTNIQTTLHTGLEFPAITFCNGNPFRKSELSSPQYADYMADNYTRRSKIEEMKMVIDLDKLNDTELYKLGHPFEIFLMKGMDGCYFQSKLCNLTEDFVRISSPVFGNCFTFKSKGRKQSRVNSASGLFTMLNINQEDYGSSVLSWSTVAGAKVMIHQPDEFLPESKAIYLAPGTWTDIKIEKITTKRLEAPYSDNCRKGNYMPRALKIPVRYTTEFCQNICYVNLQMEECGYTTPFVSSALKSTLSLLGTESSDLRNKYKVAENESQIGCLLKFDEKFMEGKVNCNCSPPCYEETFKITTSSSMWPPLNRAETLLYTMMTIFEQRFDYWTVDTLYKNVLAANIYFKDFTVQTVEQKPAYEVSDFASDLGGQLGLWIGSSVFSAFEFCAFLMSLLVYMIFLKKKGQVQAFK